MMNAQELKQPTPPRLCIGGHFSLTERDLQHIKLEWSLRGSSTSTTDTGQVMGLDAFESFHDEEATYDSGEDPGDCSEKSFSFDLLYRNDTGSYRSFQQMYEKADFIHLLEEQIRSKLLAIRKLHSSLAVQLMPARLIFRDTASGANAYALNTGNVISPNSTSSGGSGIGTVLVALSSSHKGGDVLITPRHGWNETVSITFGTLSSLPVSQWVAYFDDACSVELRPVDEGAQVLMVFRIELAGHSQSHTRLAWQRYPAHCQHWAGVERWQSASLCMAENPNEAKDARL